MALFDRVVSGVQRLKADTGGATSVDPENPRFWNSMAAGYSGGMRIDQESVSRIGCAQACISTIGRNIAPMPLKVYTETPTGKRLAKECAEYNLLYRTPNDRQTSAEFRQTMQGHFEIHGNAYAEKVMDRRGATRQLLPMHPARITPQILSNGKMRYRYNDPLTNGTRVLVADEVFHLRNWSDDGYVGQSTLVLGRDVFGVAMAAQDYTARFFQNDAKPSLYMQQKDAAAPRFKTKEDKEEFREDMRRNQSGANRHKVMLVPPGWDLKELSINPDKAQLLEARKFSRIEICSIYGVPPHLVGETEKAATYASVEQFNIMFVTQCIMPRIVLWEQALQRDILQDETFSAKFSMASLLRGDNASRTAAYAVAFQNGWLSVNDIRLLEDLDPIPDGDTYFRYSSLIPLSQIAEMTDGGTGDGGAATSKQLKDLEADDTKKADVIHNTHVLAALAAAEHPDATRALQEMR